MKKQAYQKPAMRVVELQQQARLLAGSDTFNATSTNLGNGDDFIFDGSDSDYTGGGR